MRATILITLLLLASCTASERQPEAPSEPEDPNIRIAERLTGSLATPDTHTLSEETIDAAKGLLQRYQIAWQLVQDADSSGVDSIVGLGAQYRKYLAKTQATQFPAMRKAIAVGLKNRLWEEDITVSYSGPGNVRLHFVGGRFASNKNIKAYIEALEPVVSNYRFKRVTFQWYASGDYTYYDFKPDPDTAPVKTLR